MAEVSIAIGAGGEYGNGHPGLVAPLGTPTHKANSNSSSSNDALAAIQTADRTPLLQRVPPVAWISLAFAVVRYAMTQQHAHFDGRIANYGRVCSVVLRLPLQHGRGRPGLSVFGARRRERAGADDLAH